MLEVDRIILAGTGLLGGSIGLGLRAAGFKGTIIGAGRSPQRLAQARERGCIDTAVALDSLGEALAKGGLVILATPISLFEGLLSQIARHSHDALVITDVGSTKQHVCSAARRVLPDPRRFIGSHPMAGGERHGFESARADLFRGKPCIVTPEADADPAALRAIEALWATLGMKPVRMTPAEHDAQAARISHLPHLVAALLVDLASQRGGLDIASTGFLDTTRVASSDPDVWKDIFATNRAAVTANLDALIASLTHWRGALAEGRDDDLAALLRRSKGARDQWVSRGPLGWDDQE